MPRYQRLTLGRRAFSVAGPTVWNSLPDELRDEPDDMFRKSLKTLFSDSISVFSALEVFTTMRSINQRFTYLLTYLTLTLVPNYRAGLLVS